jgi:ATP-dependent DNA helicase RecG
MVLKRFGLVSGEYLTNAGNVLFGNSHPITLKAAIFATDEKLTFLDMQMYEDNILNLLRLAETYILKNISWRSEIIGTEREEIPEIPVAAIREVLANSYAHAVYNSNTYHEICIHPDKVTVYSPGTFASTYSPEDYIRKNLPSAIRNAHIARILYLNKSIEQFGSGFKRIDSLCKDANVKYSYEISESGFQFVFIRNIPKALFINDRTGSNGSVNVALNKTEQAVYNLLVKKPDYTREELAEATSKTVRTIQRTLDSLRKKGLVERIGSDKSGYWEVKEPPTAFINCSSN